MPGKNVFSEDEVDGPCLNHSLNSDETRIMQKKNDAVKCEAQGESMSLYFELASSLNVELVYIILKSITQFAYVQAS